MLESLLVTWGGAIGAVVVVFAMDSADGEYIQSVGYVDNLEAGLEQPPKEADNIAQTSREIRSVLRRVIFFRSYSSFS